MQGMRLMVAMLAALFAFGCGRWVFGAMFRGLVVSYRPIQWQEVQQMRMTMRMPIL